MHYMSPFSDAMSRNDALGKELSTVDTPSTLHRANASSNEFIELYNRSNDQYSYMLNRMIEHYNTIDGNHLPQKDLHADGVTILETELRGDDGIAI